MDREYIKIPKSSLFSDSVCELKQMNDEFWKNEIFRHLLLFYKKYDVEQLQYKIEKEKQKNKPQIENCITEYIIQYLEKDMCFNMHFDAVIENKNNESKKKGFYDVTIMNTYWVNKDNPKQKVRFHIECKNLDKSQDLVNKYVYYNKGHNVFDGGVYRFFNGKYAQQQYFGGMIGFVLVGDLLENYNQTQR